MLDTIKRYLKVFFSVRLLPVLVVYILLFALLINRMFQLQIVWAGRSGWGRVKGMNMRRNPSNRQQKHARLKQHVEISMIVMESYWPIMHYRIT